jgi:predicted enzyme related to lactoylglutathione lyase
VTETTSSLLGRPLWYELMTTDMAAAERFYRAVVGWTTTPFKEARHPYTIFNRSGDVPVGGVMNRPDEVQAPPFWAMYVGVPHIEEAAAQIASLGGSAHTDVLDVGPIGRMQLMRDPQGAAFYIYEPVRRDQPPEAAPQPGDVSWHELMTTDASAAMQFYQRMFGWKPSQAMDMGDMGTYQMFDRPHGTIGGMMNKPPQMANVPPNWQIYFLVPDVHETAQRITADGGSILNGPLEVPGGDWVVTAMDPQGAAFGLHSRKR